MTSDWSTIMIATAAEMKSKDKEELVQAVKKELGMKQSSIDARLEGEPVHTHRKILIIMITQARYRAAQETKIAEYRNRKK